MKKIILDTNFIMIPAQFKVDIYEEIKRIMKEKYELCALDKTIDELKKIMTDKNQKGKDKAAAKLGLAILKAKKVKIIKTTKDKDVDSLIVERADKGYIVATQDRALKKRLKNKADLIILRKKSFLAKTEAFI